MKILDVDGPLMKFLGTAFDFFVLFLLTVILCITQMLRLAKKNTARKREKAILCIRLAVLLPLLCLSLALPLILGAAAGYPGFGYAAFRVWGLDSGLIMCLLLDTWIVCMIAAGILRYLRLRKTA